MMVGVPDYDAYLRHMRSHHPDRAPMDRTRRLDLRSLMTRAEAAAPVGVVDAMAVALL